MNQHQRELNLEVARATGESLETIEAMGFSVLTMAPPWVVVDHRARLGDLTRRKTRRRRAPQRPCPGGWRVSVVGVPSFLHLCL